MAHLKIINVSPSSWLFIRQKVPPLPTRQQAKWKTVGVEDVEDRQCLTHWQTEPRFLGRAFSYSSPYSHWVTSAPLGEGLSSILCDKNVRSRKCTLWRIKTYAYVLNESESKSFGLKENSACNMNKYSGLGIVLSFVISEGDSENC